LRLGIGAFAIARGQSQDLVLICKARIVVRNMSAQEMTMLANAENPSLDSTGGVNGSFASCAQNVFAPRPHHMTQQDIHSF
jgi:acetyl-CoA carboxylase beta subunit